jgi:hypothetical protein
MSDDRINGMQLPSNLMKALRDGAWLAQGKHWKTVFPADEVVMPSLYSMNLIRRENESWFHETHPAFIGVPDERAVPGALDPRRSVLIGDLQPDAMIALDYRSGDDCPSVAYLNTDGQWVEVAVSFDQFWCRLIAGA